VTDFDTNWSAVSCIYQPQSTVTFSRQKLTAASDRRQTAAVNVCLSRVQQSVIDKAIDQWRSRLTACVHASGPHVEQLINYCLFVEWFCFYEDIFSRELKTLNLKVNIHIIPFLFVQNSYFEILQGSVATIFRRSWKILWYFMANISKSKSVKYCRSYDKTNSEFFIAQCIRSMNSTGKHWICMDLQPHSNHLTDILNLSTVNTCTCAYIQTKKPKSKYTNYLANTIENDMLLVTFTLIRNITWESIIFFTISSALKIYYSQSLWVFVLSLHNVNISKSGRLNQLLGVL